MEFAVPAMSVEGEREISTGSIQTCQHLLRDGGAKGIYLLSQIGLSSSIVCESSGKTCSLCFNNNRRYIPMIYYY